ncbi:MAG TPA: glucan ABC transporter ATP-binding protein/ permease [Pseudolabrys sp.]|nr:glucan ABC transporter ATP-binding protein/ permease [Pseudolabrys sp.]
MNLLRLYARVLSLLGSEGKLAWFLALGNLALAIAQFAEPVLLGRIIDTLTGAQTRGAMPEWPKLAMLLGAWAGFGIFTIVCGTLIALYADRLAHRRRHVVATGYFEHVLQLPLSYHGNTHSGRLMKMMLSGTEALWSLWVGFFRDNLASLISLLVLLPISLFVNWRLALLLIVLCVVFAALTAMIVRKTETMQSSVERHYSDLAERASDALGNIALVQSFSRLEAEVSELRLVVERLLSAQMPVLSWWALANVLTRTATTLTVLSIIIVGTLLTMNGQATVGEMVTFMNFAGLIIARLEHSVSFLNTVVSEAPSLRDFFQVWDTVPSIRDEPNAIDPGRLRGEVEFKHVSFSYDGKRLAVEDLNFKAMPGETVALVGATGAGKSTAIALLHRAFDPQAGHIEIDGTDIRNFKLSALRRNIGVVFQETLLFNRSIAENLQVGKPDATEAEMRSAVERAQALEFIERKFQGFDDNVGERGRSLSGGERQRLSIARALLKDPPILILDEATSALDTDTEAKVMLALDEVMKGRTTFVIAHRLSTVRKASRILVFDRGKIVEKGTFDELVIAGGRFARLAQQQFISAEPIGYPIAVK